jgi:hypothetical protein
MQRHARSSRLALALALIVLGATIGPLASCEMGDAVCPDNTVEEDRDDDCPYGPPGGPQRSGSTKCVVALGETNCTHTFRDDVFPILVAPVAPRSGGGCTLPACHGANTQGGAVLLLPEGLTPDDLYARLVAFKNDAGDPYLEQDNPNAWFLCNLKAQPGGGNAMPKPTGLTDSAQTAEDDQDLVIIDEWVRCGMKLDGTGMGTGASTSTGGVGVGGGGGGG